jgi:preprotein translocase subunit YajC
MGTVIVIYVIWWFFFERPKEKKVKGNGKNGIRTLTKNGKKITTTLTTQK